VGIPLGHLIAKQTILLERSRTLRPFRAKDPDRSTENSWNDEGEGRGKRVAFPLEVKPQAQMQVSSRETSWQSSGHESV
jgi:hypothetical protein